MTSLAVTVGCEYPTSTPCSRRKRRWTMRALLNCLPLDRRLLLGSIQQARRHCIAGSNAAEWYVFEPQQSKFCRVSAHDNVGIDQDSHLGERADLVRQFLPALPAEMVQCQGLLS